MLNNNLDILAEDYLSALPPGSIQSSQHPVQELSADSLTRHHFRPSVYFAVP